MLYFSVLWMLKYIIQCRPFIGEGVRSWSSLSAGRRHFSSARKKKLWCTKSIPNDIVECMDQGFYKKKSPDHLFQVIRWSGAVLTLCSPKKLLFLQKSLFLDGALTQIYNLFMKKTPQSMIFSLRPPLHPHASPFWVASETGDCNTA